jgi:hypothetical protein
LAPKQPYPVKGTRNATLYTPSGSLPSKPVEKRPLTALRMQEMEVLDESRKMASSVEQENTGEKIQERIDGDDSKPCRVSVFYFGDPEPMNKMYAEQWKQSEMPFCVKTKMHLTCSLCPPKTSTSSLKP